MISKRLITVVQWTIYALIFLVILLAMLSLFVCVTAPTFFPNANISGFTNYIDTIAIILSFLSVVLGLFSVWQAYESGKQETEMMHSIHDLKQQQNDILITLNSTNRVATPGILGTWMSDDVLK